jgi:hypothetical protein
MPVEVEPVSLGELGAAHEAGMAQLFPFKFFDPTRRRWITSN